MKVTLFLLLLAANSFPQTAPACSLSVKDFPAVRRLKLGMSEKEVKAVLGSDYATYFAADWYRVTGSTDIEHIRVEFTRDRVSYFAIHYDRSLKWNNADEFATVISGHLPLPLTAWQRIHRDLSSMACADFRVSADTLYNKLEFTSAADAFSAESERTDWKRKAAFKP